MRIVLGVSPRSRLIFCASARGMVLCCLTSLLLLSPAATLVHADCHTTGICSGEDGTTNPKSRDNTVTATVSDSNTAPSTPILVSPGDGSTVADTTPTLIWKQSTDDQGIDKYQLHVDGNLLFDNIPNSSTVNASYTLVLDGTELKLTPNAGFTQGNHTWFIRAFDAGGLTATSDTWDFTVDTVAPVTTISSIGDTSVSITSADAGSVPVTPVVITDSTPSVVGTSETGASLQLTLSVPGDPDQVFTISVTGGAYSIALGTMPLNTIISFSIATSDSVGNTSTITNVRFIVESPSGSPTATASASATPTSTPEVSPEPTSTPLPSIEDIITAPPEERRLDVIKELLSAQPFLNALADNPVFQTIAELAPVLYVLAPLAVSTAVASQAAAPLFLPIVDLISRVLQSLGLIPVRKPRGIVFDTKTGEPVPFATISIIRIGSAEIETVISDEEGVYRSIQMPVGTYRMEAIHPEYTFPTKQVPGFRVNPHDYYRGEEFTIQKENQEELFLIPMDPVESKSKKKFALQTKIFISFMKRFIYFLFYPAAAFSVVMTLLYPTWPNLFIVILYAVMIIIRMRRGTHSPFLLGTVTDKAGAPLPHVMIRCMESGTNTLHALVLTDDKGMFRVHLPPRQYALVFTREGYVLASEHGDFSTMFVPHTGTEGSLKVVMVTLQEAFGK